MMHAEMLQILEGLRFVACLQQNKLHRDRRILELELLTCNPQKSCRLFTISGFKAVALVFSFLLQVLLERHSYKIDGAAEKFNQVHLVARNQHTRMVALHKFIMCEDVVPAAVVTTATGGKEQDEISSERNGKEGGGHSKSAQSLLCWMAASSALALSINCVASTNSTAAAAFLSASFICWRRRGWPGRSAMETLLSPMFTLALLMVCEVTELSTLPRRRRLKAQVLPLPHGPKNKTLSFVSASLLFFLGLANSLYDNSINKMVTTAATTWCHSIVFKCTHAVGSAAFALLQFGLWRGCCGNRSAMVHFDEWKRVCVYKG